MKKKFIALCVPSRGKAPIEFTHHLLQVIYPLNYGQVTNFFSTQREPVPVDVARNQLVANMESFETEYREVSHLFWLDDDVLVQPTVILRLFGLNRLWASGVYFTKDISSQPVAFPGVKCGSIEYVPNTRLEVDVVGAGLSLIRMDVYRQMRAKLDLGKDSRGNTAYYRYTGPRSARIDEGSIVAREGEDVYFCRRAAEIGIKPLVDCSYHSIGWHHDMETGRTYPEEQFRQHIRGEKIVWETSQGPMEWKE